MSKESNIDWATKRARQILEAQRRGVQTHPRCEKTAALDLALEHLYTLRPSRIEQRAYDLVKLELCRVLNKVSI